ncbi:hypothetical protein [Pelagibacterium sediminicola]|nr:hypothetical protein [Pelagibacterium sediminicola]
MRTLLSFIERTRRKSAPRVTIDLDVFTPSGRRAARLFFGWPDNGPGRAA